MIIQKISMIIQKISMIIQKISMIIQKFSMIIQKSSTIIQNTIYLCNTYDLLYYNLKKKENKSVKNFLTKCIRKCFCKNPWNLQSLLLFQKLSQTLVCFIFPNLSLSTAFMRIKKSVWEFKKSVWEFKNWYDNVKNQYEDSKNL